MRAEQDDWETFALELTGEWRDYDEMVSVNLDQGLQLIGNLKSLTNGLELSIEIANIYYFKKNPSKISQSQTNLNHFKQFFTFLG